MGRRALLLGSGLALAGMLAGWLISRDDPVTWPAWRIAAMAAGASLWLCWGLTRTGPGRSRRRAWLHGLSALLLCAWAGAAVGSSQGWSVEKLLTQGRVQPWTFFHYYLGAKYFPELGYHGLYEQALAADAEFQQAWVGHIGVLRNLESYEVERLMPRHLKRSAAFSDDRWREFAKDLQTMQGWMRPADWRRLFVDRGYNATPTWTAVGRVLTQLGLGRVNRSLLGGLDLLLLLVAFVAAGRCFGLVPSLVAAGWLCLFYGNEHHLVGRLFIHDYLAALILAMCAMRRARPATAGALVAYAAAVRIFPVFFAMGLGLWILLRWRRQRSWPWVGKRFMAGFVLAGLFWAALGLGAGGGLSAWLDAGDNLKTHGQEHRYGERRIGLAHLFTHDLGAESWEAKPARRENWRGQWPAFAGTAILLAALCLLALWRGPDDEPLTFMLMGLGGLFIAVVLSRYYGSIYCLFFFWGLGRRGPVLLQAGLLAMVALYYALAWNMGSAYGWYWMANGLFLLWWLAAFGWRLMARRGGPALRPSRSASG